MKKVWMLALLAVTVAGAAQAQSKKELVAKLLQLQQPSIELAARALVERPAAQLMQQAGLALQTQVAPEKREAIGKQIQADVKKYLDESVPLVRDRAIQLAPTTVGTLLDEKFTEDELKQLIALIESPVNRKFVQMGGDLQKALIDKLVAETQGAIEPKVKIMEQAVTQHLALPVAAKAKPVSKK
jgi:hypothetical protein